MVRMGNDGHGIELGGVGPVDGFHIRPHFKKRPIGFSWRSSLGLSSFRGDGLWVLDADGSCVTQCRCQRQLKLLS